MSNNSLPELITKIKTGSREEVKTAQKKIEKAANSAKHNNLSKTKKDFKIFIKEIKNFADIKSIDNQAYFINILKHPFLILGEKHFKEFAEFILQQIQNPSGKIRMSVIRAADWLLLATDCSIPSSYKLTPAKIKQKENNMKQFCLFAYAAERLLDLYREPQHDRYKYIDNLPTGVYKSLEMLMSDCILRSGSRKELYEKFMDENIRQPFCNPEIKGFFKFVYQNRPEKVLPFIKFKYHSDSTKPHKRAAYINETCLRCGTTGIVLGASFKTGIGDIESVCEDCAIDQYQYDFGYRTKEEAKARRRRIFDVGYLFGEMLVDKYLADNQLSSIDELRSEEVQRLFMKTQEIYNSKFSLIEKSIIEEMKKQEEIENVLRIKVHEIELNPDEVRSLNIGMLEGLA